MAIAGAIGGLASGILGAVQASYQQEVAKMNEKVALYNAERARVTGTINAQENDYLVSRAKMGEQEVAQAASGVSLAGKSQIKTRDTARFVAARDRANIIDDANMKEYGYKVDAANFRAEAKAAGFSAISSIVGGVLGTASSLIGGAQPSANPMMGKPVPLAKPAPFANPTKLNIAPVAPKPTTFTPRPFNIYNPLTKRKLGVV